MTSSRVAAVAAAITFVLVLGACGSGGGDDAAEPTPTPSVGDTASVDPSASASSTSTATGEPGSTASASAGTTTSSTADLTLALAAPAGLWPTPYPVEVTVSVRNTGKTTYRGKVGVAVKQLLESCSACSETQRAPSVYRVSGSSLTKVSAGTVSSSGWRNYATTRSVEPGQTERFTLGVDGRANVRVAALAGSRRGTAVERTIVRTYATTRSEDCPANKSRTCRATFALHNPSAVKVSHLAPTIQIRGFGTDGTASGSFNANGTKCTVGFGGRTASTTKTSRTSANGTVLDLPVAVAAGATAPMTLTCVLPRLLVPGESFEAAIYVLFGAGGPVFVTDSGPLYG